MDVGEGRGELDVDGVADGSLEGSAEGLVCLVFEGLGLVTGVGSSVGALVASRWLTSLAVKAGIEAGVTALPTICTAIQPLTIATEANTAQSAAIPPREPRIP
ncbi:MAG: hypothetical protein ABI720_07625 [Actinomycetes bacterium]